MNCIIRSKAYRIQKGSFTTEKGEPRNFAKVTIVDTYDDNDNAVGYKFASISFDYESYGTLKELLKKNADIDFNIEINTSSKGEISRKIVSFKEAVK